MSEKERVRLAGKKRIEKRAIHKKAENNSVSNANHGPKLPIKLYLVFLVRGLRLILRLWSAHTMTIMKKTCH